MKPDRIMSKMNINDKTNVRLTIQKINFVQKQVVTVTSSGLVLNPLHLLDDCDVVSLEHDPSQLSLRLLFGVELHGFVQHQVHVLIKADNVALNAGVHLLVHPDTDSGTILEVPENEIDGLHHCL